MNHSKPRVIKDFEKIDSALQTQIRSAYPDGFADYLINYVNKDGLNVSALPYQTENVDYLIKMTYNQATSLEKSEGSEDSGLVGDLKVENLSAEFSDDESYDSEDEDHEDDL